MNTLPHLSLLSSVRLRLMARTIRFQGCGTSPGQRALLDATGIKQIQKIISLRAKHEFGWQRVESVWKATNLIRKHSTTLHGHRTSISLEDAFWDELRIIAEKRKMSFAALLAEIDDARPEGSNLSSSLRVYVLNWLKSQ